MKFELMNQEKIEIYGRWCVYLRYGAKLAGARLPRIVPKRARL